MAFMLWVVLWEENGRVGSSELQKPLSALAAGNLGCRFDTPGKRKPQLKNCLPQIVLHVRLWGHYLDHD